MASKLPRSFYDGPSAEVARDLLGKRLVRRVEADLLAGRIVEAEAYGGSEDPGSHAFRGPTPRNEVMFGRPGYVYVYRIYSIHFCLNVVCEPQGVAAAVLLRALEPLEGINVMQRNRSGRTIVELCNGPGKLCQAMAITRRQNGLDLEGDEIWVEDDGFVPPTVAVSSRVGLSRGQESHLRFYLSGNPFVSPGKPSIAPPV